jgi:CheY-like chemotaxis protein
LSNAIKFTTEGSIHLGYEVRDADIRFYVTDTGTGIPKDQLDKVFERFTKLNAKKQGTGLGLSISRMIVEKLGGEIGVESEEGKGSTFWFTLPVQPLENSFSNEVVIEQSLVMSEEVNRSVTSDEKKTLLVAEDMEDNFLLCEALLGKKYKLIHAWNGEEAISLFLKHNPAAILMDLRMPVVDGYQAAEAIRQISATVPIIAVTAFAFAEDKHRVMSSGFTDYLSKPIQADTLNEKLHSVGL